MCTTKHQEVSNMRLDMHNTAYILCAILVTGVFGRKGGKGKSKGMTVFIRFFMFWYFGWIATFGLNPLLS